MHFLCTPLLPLVSFQCLNSNRWSTFFLYTCQLRHWKEWTGKEKLLANYSKRREKVFALSLFKTFLFLFVETSLVFVSEILIKPSVAFTCQLKQQQQHKKSSKKDTRKSAMSNSRLRQNFSYLIRVLMWHSKEN